MKGTEVLKLIDAGFTAEEIRKMDDPAAPEGDPEEKKAAPEDPEEKKAAPEDPEEKKAAPEDPENAAIKTLNEAVAALAKQIQSLNIKESRQKEQPKETPVDILATIINPPTK